MKYTYIYKTSDGIRREGAMDAPSRDEVFMALRKEGIRYVFQQDIYRQPDERLVLRSTVEAVCLVNGWLSDCPELDALLGCEAQQEV